MITKTKAKTKVVADPKILQRATNCLYGGAIGDALGGRYEFDRENLLHTDLQHYKSNLLPILGGGIWDLVPGQVTDDTEMAMALASSLLAEDKVDQEKIAQAYHRWYLSDPFDIGNATQNAVSKDNAQDMLAAARTFDKKCSRLHNDVNLSNGMLMRIAPLALMCVGIISEKEEGKDVGIGTEEVFSKIMELVRCDAELTHASPAALAFATAYVCLIAYGIRDGNINGGIHILDKYLARGDCYTCLQNGLDPQGRLAHAPTEKIGDARIAFQLAVRKACMVGEGSMTFPEAIISTVKLGGDTDTNAAIVGNLCGAVSSRAEDIPQTWKETLHSGVHGDKDRRSHHHKPNLLLLQLPRVAEYLLSC